MTVDFVFKQKNGFEKSFMNSNEPWMIALIRFLDAFLGYFLFCYFVDIYGAPVEYLKEIGLIIAVLIVLIFHFNAIYRSFRFSTLQYELYSIGLASLSLYTLLFVLAYIIGIIDQLPRTPILAWMVVWPLSLTILRLCIRKALRQLRQRGYNIKKAVIAGRTPAGVSLANHIRNNTWTGAAVLGFFDDDASQAETDLPLLGSLKDIGPYIRKTGVDILYIALNGKQHDPVKALIKDLETTPVAIHYVPDLFFLDLIVGGEIIFFDRRPIIVLRQEPIGGISGVFKRLFDLCVSIAVLVVLSPILVTIASIIKFTSPGPILFIQDRYGINGEKIAVYKFRTMFHHKTPETGPYQQARKGDRRITPVGAILRRTSLDELPQLINVIQGKMSLVGPRPHPVAMNEAYRNRVAGYMIRHKVKPGLTGLAQVKGFRGETDTMEKMEKRIEYDLMYIREWSLLLDIEILLRTFFVFLFQKNAY